MSNPKNRVRNSHWCCPEHSGAVYKRSELECKNCDAVQTKNELSLITFLADFVVCAPEKFDGMAIMLHQRCTSKYYTTNLLLDAIRLFRLAAKTKNLKVRAEHLGKKADVTSRTVSEALLWAISNRESKQRRLAL